MKVLVVDDHAVVRLAVSMILSNEGHEIIGEFDNGVDAISAITKLNPDVVVLDLDIPLLDGMSVVERLKSLNHRTAIIIYTGLKSYTYASRCLRAGVSAFVSKEEDTQELVEAMRAIVKHKRYFPAEVMTYGSADQREDDERHLLARISRRELRVLHGLSLGMSNKEIAVDMLLSNKTVSTYKARIMQKLEVSNIMELIDFARRNKVN